MSPVRFTVILTPDAEDDAFAAECPAIPGCVSAGATVEEALCRVKEAIEACIESRVMHGEPPPQDRHVIVAAADVTMPVMTPSRPDR